MLLCITISLIGSSLLEDNIKGYKIVVAHKHPYVVDIFSCREGEEDKHECAICNNDLASVVQEIKPRLISMNKSINVNSISNFDLSLALNIGKYYYIDV